MLDFRLLIAGACERRGQSQRSVTCVVVSHSRSARLLRLREERKRVIGGNVACVHILLYQRTRQVLLVLRSFPARLSQGRLTDEMESGAVHVNRMVSYTSLCSCVNRKHVTSMLYLIYIKHRYIKY